MQSFEVYENITLVVINRMCSLHSQTSLVWTCLYAGRVNFKNTDVSVFMCKQSSFGEKRKCMTREWSVLWPFPLSTPAFCNVTITFSLLLSESLSSLFGAASDLSHQPDVRHSAIAVGSGRSSHSRRCQWSLVVLLNHFEILQLKDFFIKNCLY